MDVLTGVRVGRVRNRAKVLMFTSVYVSRRSYICIERRSALWEILASDFFPFIFSSGSRSRGMMMMMMMGRPGRSWCWSVSSRASGRTRRTGS